MTRGQAIAIAAASAAVATLLLALTTWITGGSYDPNRVRLIAVALVFPMLLAAKAGLERDTALGLTFLVYFVLAFALLACYVRRDGASSPK